MGVVVVPAFGNLFFLGSPILFYICQGIVQRLLQLSRRRSFGLGVRFMAVVVLPGVPVLNSCVVLCLCLCCPLSRYSSVQRVCKPRHLLRLGHGHAARVHVHAPVIEGFAVIAPGVGHVQPVLAGKDKVVSVLSAVDRLDDRLRAVIHHAAQGVAARGQGIAVAQHRVLEAVVVGKVRLDLVHGRVGDAVAAEGVAVVGDIGVVLGEGPADAPRVGGGGRVLGIAVEVALGQHLVHGVVHPDV